MFRTECLRCLCKTCTRVRCRYKTDICFARCCNSARSVLFCAEYHSRPKRKIYFIVKKTARSSDYLKKMNLYDFLKQVGEIINDTKRD